MKLRPMPLSMARERIRARRIFAAALRTGAVTRRDRCERCGRSSDGPRNSLHGVEAHHPDYAKPLDVQWLCHWCHLDADHELRKALRAQPEVSA
jgi:hypothetical protein